MCIKSLSRSSREHMLLNRMKSGCRFITTGNFLTMAFFMWWEDTQGSNDEIINCARGLEKMHCFQFYQTFNFQSFFSFCNCTFRRLINDFCCKIFPHLLLLSTRLIFRTFNHHKMTVEIFRLDKFAAFVIHYCKFD